MFHFLWSTHPSPYTPHLSTRLTSSLHPDIWETRIQNTWEESRMRITPTLQYNPSLAPRAQLTPLHTIPPFTDNQYRPQSTKEIVTNTILTTTTRYLPPPTLMRYVAFLSPFTENNHTSALVHIDHSLNPTLNQIYPRFISSELILCSCYTTFLLPLLNPPIRHTSKHISKTETYQTPKSITR